VNGLEVTAAIAALLRSRPALSASDAVWADWFDQKADVFAGIAQGSTDPDTIATAQASVVTARGEAARRRARMEVA
jgi:hypothetical protein